MEQVCRVDQAKQIHQAPSAARCGERQVASGRKASWNWNASTRLRALWLPIFRPHVFFLAILNNQYDKQPFGVTLRVAKKWFNETLEGELAGSLLLNRSGYLVRPKLVYAYSDSIKLIGGVEYFGGSDKTSYGRQDRNRGVFAELRYFF